MPWLNILELDTQLETHTCFARSQGAVAVHLSTIPPQECVSWGSARLAIVWPKLLLLASRKLLSVTPTAGWLACKWYMPEVCLLHSPALGPRRVTQRSCHQRGSSRGFPGVG